MALVPYAKENQRKYTSIVTRQETVNNGNPLTTTGVYQKAYVDTFNGYRQDNWRFKLRNKENATTPASGNKQTFKDPIIIGSLRYEAPGQSVYRTVTGSASAIFGEDAFIPPGTSVPPGGTYNRALLAFLRKSKAAQRKLMTLVAVGEGRQTLNLIKKPAVSLRGLLHEYVVACRGVSRELSPKATLRYISSQWLEYALGMRPLISDINNALESAIKLYQDLNDIGVQVTIRDPFDVSVDRVVSNLWSQFIPIELNRITYRHQLVKICGSVRLMTTGKHGPLAETLGLTLPDFIPSLYELIPYSFLFDYFVNLGEVLEALSFNQADLVWHSITSKEEVTRTIEIVPVRPGTLFGYPVSSYSVTPGLYSQTFANFNRVATPLGIPSLRAKVPDTWTKALNIAALATMRKLRP